MRSSAVTPIGSGLDVGGVPIATDGASVRALPGEWLVLELHWHLGMLVALGLRAGRQGWSSASQVLRL